MQAVNLKPALLRETLGLFPAGIAVVTPKAADGALYGVTVNSFGSVSLDPPLVLFSLARRLHTLAALLSAGAFAIHFLRKDQQHISARFAKPFSNKWEGVRRRAGVTGSPAPEAALALLECRPYTQYDGGDTYVEKDTGSNPLVFFRGRYPAIGSAAPAKLP
jgi:flavin reductase (DIM6/NTAB) family NADH-FMN oxidoreductase RutF